VGILGGQVEGALGETHRLRRDAGACPVEGDHGMLEAAPLAAAQQVLHRHPAVFQVDLDHGRATDAHLVLVLAHPVARGPLLDDERRYAACPATGLGDREDGVQCRDSAVGVPLLLAVEDVDVPVTLGAGGHRSRVRSGLLLREPERDELLSRRDAGEPALLLLVGPPDEDGERPQGVHGEGDSHAAASARELLDHDAQVEHTAAHPAILLRNPDAEQSRLLDGLLDLPGIGLLDIVLGRNGAHDRLRQLPCAFPEFHLLGRVEFLDHS